MLVADVMTRNVISVVPETMVEDAIQLMLDHGISGLFVVNGSGQLAGVVTEGDLLRRGELGTERDRSWWLRLLVSPARQAADFTRAHGRHVDNVMTADVVGVAHDAPLEHAVALMEQHHVKRLPVTEAGRVIGVLARADLLRALLARLRDAARGDSDDGTICNAILAALKSQPWAPVPTLKVTSTQGVVEIEGTITSEEERSAIRVAAENVPGVKAVHDHLVYIEPYTGTVIEAPDDTA